jgi:hypothetical protein
MKELHRMESLPLCPIFKQVNHLAGVFTIISYKHVYHELNTCADGLSKEGVPMEQGQCEKIETGVTAPAVTCSILNP